MSCCVKGGKWSERQQPPRHFTDATLLSAMTGIARFVQVYKDLKILRATDGLGRKPRAPGLSNCCSNAFLTKKGATFILPMLAKR